MLDTIVGKRLRAASSQMEFNADSISALWSPSSSIQIALAAATGNIDTTAALVATGGTLDVQANGAGQALRNEGGVLSAGQLALRSPRECTTGKISCTISRFDALNYIAIELAALLVLGLALLRRNWTVVTLAGMAAGWVVVEIAFALHGFPGVPRYLFEAAGLTAVLAGLCFGWLLLDAKRYWHALPPGPASHWPPCCSW